MNVLQINRSNIGRGTETIASDIKKYLFTSGRNRYLYVKRTSNLKEIVR